MAENSFKGMDVLQQLKCEAMRSRLAAEEATSARWRAEVTLAESAAQILAYREEAIRTQRAMADSQIIALRAARRRLREAFSMRGADLHKKGDVAATLQFDKSTFATNRTEIQHAAQVACSDLPSSGPAATRTSTYEMDMSMGQISTQIVLPLSLARATPQECANYTALCHLLESVPNAGATGDGDAMPCPLDAQPQVPVGNAEYCSSYATHLHDACVTEWMNIVDTLLDAVRAEKSCADAERSEREMLQLHCKRLTEALADAGDRWQAEHGQLEKERRSMQRSLDDLSQALESVGRHVLGTAEAIRSLRPSEHEDTTQEQASGEGRDDTSLLRAALERGNAHLEQGAAAGVDATEATEGVRIVGLLHVKEGGEGVREKTVDARRERQQLRRGCKELASQIIASVQALRNELYALDASNRRNSLVAASLRSEADEEARRARLLFASAVVGGGGELSLALPYSATEGSSLSYVGAMSGIRGAVVEFHHSVLSSVFDLLGRLSLGQRQRSAVLSSLEAVCETSQRAAQIAKSSARRERQSLVAGHAVELTAATQHSASQQRRLEEMAGKLSRALARESQLRRDLKVKEGELEVSQHLSEQRGRDFSRKAAALEEAKAQLAEQSASAAVLSESLRVERTAAATAREQLALARRQTEAAEGALVAAQAAAADAEAAHDDAIRRFAAEAEELERRRGVEADESGRALSRLGKALEERRAALRSAEQEVGVLKAVANSHEGEMEGMRAELRRAKAALEEGLRRWSARSAAESTSNQFADPSPRHGQDSNVPPHLQSHHVDSVALTTAAALRISRLEAENRELRAACEMSVNQSVELMEALHRKRRSSVDNSFVSLSTNNNSLQ